MIDTPISGRDLSFEEKLLNQMTGSSPSEWAIICDIYYVYFLPSTHITFKKKQGDILWAAQQGDLRPPSKDDETWKPLEQGFTRTAIKYHVKYAQFWLII